MEIRDVQYFPDGRSLVDTIGGQRIRVVSRGMRDGYHTAVVEPIHDQPIPAQQFEGEWAKFSKKFPIFPLRKCIPMLFPGKLSPSFFSRIAKMP